MVENSRKIVSFYEFKQMSRLGPLETARDRVRECMAETGVAGTVILAVEGFNATVCGEPDAVDKFAAQIEILFQTSLKIKASFHSEAPFKRADVKIKPEIVTLKKEVDMSLSSGTHIRPDEWNDLIERKDVIVIDARNSYEYKNGTFDGAVDPKTEKFSDLPAFVEANLDPLKHKSVAMFCTGGIRCEKFAPYMRSLGFERVYQLEGGILRYLKEVPADRSKFRGECFVFDDRRTVDGDLQKGCGPDYSQEKNGEGTPGE